MKLELRKLILTLVGLALCATLSAAEERPNIILIMLDDMGFSDIGCYGGEIDTPNIDELANGGVKFSHFYNNSRCCPTRASLMTGLQPHMTGIGWMTNPTGTIRGEDKPSAYRGYLNRKCVTLAEVLKPAGYATILAGKWHLGWGAEDRWPLQRGFEKFYGCIHGAHSFNPSGFKYVSLGNEKVTEFISTTDRRYYTTDAFTDYAVQFILKRIPRCLRRGC